MFFLKIRFDKRLRRAIIRTVKKLAGLLAMKDINYYVRRHKLRSRKSRQSPTFTCFYTGLTLHKKVDPFSGYTIEHLVPKFLIRTIPQTVQHRTKIGKLHRVPAISIINHLIGHAPLIVKFGLRDHLQSLLIDDTIPLDDRIEFYARETRLYLDQFKVTIGEHRVNHMPWYYASMAEQEYRDKLFDAYYGLLTREEKILLAMKVE